ncbi:MAG: imidazolonepropionase [Comamonas sp.]|nr:imidazolonepropionase [Comamonas sp.]
MQRLWRHARLATLVDGGWGLIEDGALVTEGEHIRWVGPLAALPASMEIGEEIGLDGALVMPGLVDCHTHLVYGGDRAAEAEMRLNGAGYEEIARAGGGIRSTVSATRAASEDALLHGARRRAQALMAGGVTTLEIKSGYGLSLEAEAKCLRVARRLGREVPVQVRTTYLGAHALPPEFEGRSDDYVDAVCHWMRALHAQGLVDAVDAFCESIAFSPVQVARVFEAARALDLPVKLHAEQLSDQGGAQLAASFGALSADHLEYLSDAGIAAMRAAGTVAVLLPGAYYMLRETRQPPVAALRAAGVPIAVASDHNPGTAPGLSLPLAAHMACTFFRLTPLEAVAGITHQAARALGLHDRGLLRAGLRADFAVWELNHPNELVYWFGHDPCRAVVQGAEVRT